MPLVFNSPRFRREEIGMPDAHAACFRQVAEMQKCVILVRATGPTCKQLLEQGYDTKGFRIHGKSCNWGPMAGFVLRDPRLNKYGMGKAAYNREEHHEALTDTKAGAGWTASTVPLKIFESRRLWLAREGLLGTVKAVNPNRYDCEVAHDTGVRFAYSLLRDPNDANVWGVWLDNTRNHPHFKQERGSSIAYYHPQFGQRFETLLAMTNSEQHRSWPNNDFRNAVTGDYDLFAVWPFVKDYDHLGADRRILGTARAWTQRHHIEHNLERRFTAGGQGTKIGNITNRIYEVSQFLNSKIGSVRCTDDMGVSFPPCPNRMVVWHSDEAARPFVNDVDLPVIAFSPSKNEYGISAITDFKIFVNEAVGSGIKVNLGEGWVLDKADGKQNRLGSGFAHLVPSWDRGTIPGAPMIVPDWYNR